MPPTQSASAKHTKRLLAPENAPRAAAPPLAHETFTDFVYCCASCPAQFGSGTTLAAHLERLQHVSAWIAFPIPRGYSKY